MSPQRRPHAAAACRPARPPARTQSSLSAASPQRTTRWVRPAGGPAPCRLCPAPRLVSLCLRCWCRGAGRAAHGAAPSFLGRHRAGLPGSLLPPACLLPPAGDKQFAIISKVVERAFGTVMSGVCELRCLGCGGGRACRDACAGRRQPLWPQAGGGGRVGHSRRWSAQEVSPLVPSTHALTLPQASWTASTPLLRRCGLAQQARRSGLADPASAASRKVLGACAAALARSLRRCSPAPRRATRSCEARRLSTSATSSARGPAAQRPPGAAAASTASAWQSLFLLAGLEPATCRTTLARVHAFAQPARVPACRTAARRMAAAAAAV